MTTTPPASVPPPVSSPAWSRSPRPPAAVDIVGAMFIGLIAGVLCALAVGLKYRFGYDDSLDVVGVHLVGGIVGTVLIGFFANVPGTPTASSPRTPGRRTAR